MHPPKADRPASAFLIAAVLATTFSVTPPVVAGDCTTWKASMEELEEGRALVASVCAKDDERTIVMVQCLPQGLNIRYMPAVDGDFSNFQRDIMFETDEKKRPVFVSYEGLDGAFSAYVPVGHTAVEMMKGGKTLTISDPEGKVPSATFALTGSRQAFDKLEKSCAQ